VSIVVIVLNVVSFFCSNHILLMRGIPGQSDFFPIGPKSKQSRYVLNMRVARTARMWDDPARDSTFICLNPGGSGQSSSPLKK
jgi:hypothetical protein